jgi:hypothetical protein
VIAGVLFDSGGVLIRPIGGRWNPRHDFEGIVRSHHPAVTSFAAAGQKMRKAPSAGAASRRSISSSRRTRVREAPAMSSDVQYSLT